MHAAEQPLQGLKLWQVSLSGLLAKMNDSRHHCLALEGMSDTNMIESWTMSMHRDWGIHNEAELIDMIDWLEEQGHNASFQKMAREWLGVSETELQRVSRRHEGDQELSKLQLVTQHQQSLKECGVFAWDIGRAAHLARCGFYTYMISEQRCWELMDRLTALVYPRFSGWLQYGLSYTVGRAYWQAGYLDENYCDGVFAHLRSIQNDPEHPWNWLSWDTPAESGFGGSTSEPQKPVFPGL